jgi:hypothetical protein
MFLAPLLSALVSLLDVSPHMEFLLQWVKGLLVSHGPTLTAAAGGGTALRAAVAGGSVSGGGGGGPGAAAAAAAAGGVGASLRALQQVVGRLAKDLGATAEANVYLLGYLVEAGKLAQEQTQQQEKEPVDDEGLVGMQLQVADKVQRKGSGKKEGSGNQQNQQQRRQRH